MTSQNEGEFVIKIGTNGEIIPPKQIRDKLGLIADAMAIGYVDGDSLIIRKLDSVDDILSKEPKVKISSQAFKELRVELGDELGDKFELF